jgi:acyl-CoA reductase-like NAD-dependent aldehyde dehydrogenase
MQAYDEMEYGYMYFKWYLENASKYLSPEITRETEKELHTVYFEAKGVIVAIAPWNYPFSMFVWTSIQALLA